MTAGQAIEHLIVALLAERSATSTICPSDVARTIAADDFRPWMEPVRLAARRLVARGEIEVTQGGRVVDADSARGPIRLRRKRS